MSIHRIAIVFDNTQRPETTGWYCRRALMELVRESRLTEVEHFLPHELEQVSSNHFDLFLLIDDGLRYEIPKALRPRAWWAIDTHLDFARTLKRAWESDFVFAAQRDGAERFRRSGLSGVTWLPLACDPAIHRPHALAKRWDVAFVGHELPGERTRLLHVIRREFPNHFIGQCYREQMAETYSAAKIAFNRSIQNDINMRVFEALACGSLLLTNDLAHNGQAELFEAGTHLVTYNSDDELLEKARYYIERERQREQIAQRGLHEVRQFHTYRQRLETILTHIENTSAPRSVSVPRALSAPPVSVYPVPAKEPAYFEFARPDVLELIPASARRVLDVGCGAGRLGASLKQRQPAEVVGIERCPEAAKRARAILDEVHEIDLADPAVCLPVGPFDAIVCADVLEHLPQPRLILERLRALLDPEGGLIASLPNVQHHTVVRSLLAGNFTMEPAGLLDEDHKAFFTRREIEKLFFRAGFAVESLRFRSDAAHTRWVEAGRPHTIRLGFLDIEGESPTDIEPFYVYQYLVTAKPRLSPKRGLTSIILVTHNEWNYTRQCLESLRFRTDEPYELIVVDNASTDKTRDWLRAQPDVRLIENAENRGFPAAVNQGLAVAQGEQILLLNNDTLLTTGWLGRMLDALDRDPDIGLVGPCSNRVSGPQQIPSRYGDLAELDGFAWEHGKKHAGQIAETDRLVGFCLLLTREVVERVGLFDEQFGIGCFEDDDYCRRAKQVGFRCVIAQDAFVHHFGSRTFAGSGIDLGHVLKANQGKFEAKWNNFSAASDEPEANNSTARPRLSLCMIVRDNEKTIRPCLESIRPYVDEMIVVDTGSTDLTPIICRELGARVESFPWCDDFSAARNESLKYASGEWIFWMDSDDTIPADCGHQLRELVDGEHLDSTLGYVMQVHCPGSQAGDVTVVDHVKLFRNRPDLRFEFRIHEQILPAIRRAGGEVGWTEIYVVHSGSDHSPEGQQRKLERDFRILEQDLQERPEHPFVLFNLGMTCSEANRLEEAQQYLERCLEASAPNESHLRKAYAILAAVLMRLKQNDRAYKACETGLQQFPDDPELLFRRAMLHHAAGRLIEAVQDYQSILETQTERHFSSRDVGILDYKARHNLALVYEESGQPEKAITQWQTILQERPDYTPALTAVHLFGKDKGLFINASNISSNLA